VPCVGWCETAEGVGWVGLHLCGLSFQWAPAASSAEEGRCSKSSGRSGPLTRVVWSTLYLLSFELCSPKTPRSEWTLTWEMSSWAGQSPAFPFHTPPSPSPLPRGHPNACWLHQRKSSPVLSVRGPHIYFLYQPIPVQTSEFSMPGVDIPQWFIWSSMRILEVV